MILSIVYMREGRWFKSAALYATLLMFKHIYLYSAPAFGIMYLKALCNPYTSNPARNFGLLALQTVAIFSLALGPFLYMQLITGKPILN